MNVHESVFLADGVRLAGEKITIGEGSGIWYNAVIRCGENQSVTIGKKTNIQDLCMIHTSSRGASVTVGDGTTVGHSTILHGCKIGDNTLIGMGSIIMNDAVVGNNCIIGAGTLVTEGKVIPDGHMAYGRPVKVIRELTPEEIENNRRSAKLYIKEIERNK